MAMREEREVGILRLAEIRRAVGKSLHPLPRSLPERRGLPARQERAQGLGRACEVEEVARVHQTEDLWDHCQPDEKTRCLKKNRYDHLEIVHL